MREFACDGIIIQNNKILLIRRAADPGKGQWAIPGGRIDQHEDALSCLKREMKEETNLDVEPLAFVGLYSDPKRDSRGIIAAAYLCKVTGGELKAGDDAGEANWFSLEALPELFADHKQMIKDALKLVK